MGASHERYRTLFPMDSDCAGVADTVYFLPDPVPAFAKEGPDPDPASRPDLTMPTFPATQIRFLRFFSHRMLL
jgi:hypothetical protein